MADPIIDLKLEYEPVAEDLIGTTPRIVKGKAYGQRIRPFLAYDDSGGFVHGNSHTRVLRGTEEVSNTFSTWRKWRISQVRSADTPPYALVRRDLPWSEDNLNGGPNWDDVPGQIYVAAGRGNGAWLLEFAIRIAEAPAVPGLYFFVLVELLDSEYRVRMSGGKPMPETLWKQIGKAPQPWPGAKGMTIALDSGLLLLPADHQKL